MLENRNFLTVLLSPLYLSLSILFPPLFRCIRGAHNCFFDEKIRSKTIPKHRKNSGTSLNKDMHYVRADEWIAKIWAPKKKRDMPPTIDTGKANSKFRVDQISLILPDVRKKKAAPQGEAAGYSLADN